MNPSRKMLGVVGSMLTALAWTTTAGAVCDQSAASTSDQDLWATHGMDAWYVQWHQDVYHIHSDDWQGRGLSSADQINFEYAKHWNAAWLLNVAMVTGDFSFAATPFHDGLLDYTEVGRGLKTVKWHDSMKQLAADTPTNVFGSWTWNAIGENKVRTMCLLYSPTKATATPSRRASDYVHEGWHAWKDNHGISNPWGSGGHYANAPTGLCVQKNANCDYFYAHPKADFAPGTLYTSDVDDITHYHSVLQTQMEYFCDVADSGPEQLPTSVTLAAAAESILVSGRFINGSPIVCGTAVPWNPGLGGVDNGGYDDGSSCSANSDCNSLCCIKAMCSQPSSCVK